MKTIRKERLAYSVTKKEATCRSVRPVEVAVLKDHQTLKYPAVAEVVEMKDRRKLEAVEHPDRLPKAQARKNRHHYCHHRHYRPGV